MRKPKTLQAWPTGISINIVEYNIIKSQKGDILLIKDAALWKFYILKIWIAGIVLTFLMSVNSYKSYKCIQRFLITCSLTKQAGKYL